MNCGTLGPCPIQTISILVHRRVGKPSAGGLWLRLDCISASMKTLSFLRVWSFALAILWLSSLLSFTLLPVGWSELRIPRHLLPFPSKHTGMALSLPKEQVLTNAFREADIFCGGCVK